MENTLDIIVFWISAAFAIGGAVMMVWQRNPVASALFLILSLVSQAALFVQLDAVFVAALVIIIYAGAIVALFLFVIMLLNLRGESFGGRSEGPGRYIKLGISSLLGATLVYVFSMTILPKLELGLQKAPPMNFGDVKLVAGLLYSKYLYAFELTSILLLVAIVGAVVMAKRDENEKPDADIVE